MINQNQNRAILLSVFIAFTVIFNSCQQNPYEQGKQIYIANCKGCHMEDGKGLAKLVPDITNSSFLNTRLHELPCLIRQGSDYIRPRSEQVQVMEGNKMISEVSMTNLINYLIDFTNNKSKEILPQDLSTQLNNCVYK